MKVLTYSSTSNISIPGALEVFKLVTSALLHMWHVNVLVLTPDLFVSDLASLSATSVSSQDHSVYLSGGSSHVDLSRHSVSAVSAAWLLIPLFISAFCIPLAASLHCIVTVLLGVLKKSLSVLMKDTWTVVSLVLP